eukprot:CAMPEP_0197544960 /NCGR_PEP_ID=MMETSP1320-20131121/197_1 /TAXON_ID=91990 /ORGANISM="Bolidomonas sp., Strain RCC2347" /LENGTH=299 /DNA_ID=CAMNT_0043104419 /DNA_START=32 /DNA_END=928 /DNA_ORIENTATION=+
MSISLATALLFVVTITSSFLSTSVRVTAFNIVVPCRRHADTRLALSSLATPTIMTPDATITTPDTRISALRKASKTLSVGIDIQPSADLTTTSELETLSMNLRKSGASALYTRSITVLEAVLEEQAAAAGTFPGPLPVVYTGSDIERAIAAGASSCVLPWGASIPSCESEISPMYRVNSSSDVEALYATGARAFVISDSPEAESAILSVPDDSVSVLEVDSMQDNQAEVERAQSLRSSSGLSSVLLRGACVGDGEDLEYAAFAISALTKKKSKTFNMSGLTASTNGHGGGVASLCARTW